MSKYKLDKSAQVVENSNYIMTQEEVCERLNDLQSQLAEKENEIEELKTNHYLVKKDYIVDYFVSQTNEPMQIPKFITNQDKISFCIEKLEKVKDFVKENESWEIEGSDYSIVYADDVLEEIDNQIKQLKEMK